ncbi:MAG: DUF3592 domain-containing protein [Actinomycetota bacterium]|nr:DUF3592 domain-containing protein [Actinomycetota bacterium]
MKSTHALLVSADELFFVVAGVFVLAGLASFAVGLMVNRRTREALSTEGVVLDREGSPGPSFPDQNPVFEWRDHLGVTHTTATRTKVSPGFRIGDRVPVRYLRHDPERATIATSIRPGTTYLIVAITFAMVGCLVFAVGLREWFKIH